MEKEPNEKQAEEAHKQFDLLNMLLKLKIMEQVLDYKKA